MQKCGLCISGLTIREAAVEVLKAKYIKNKVIVNLGAVDLLMGKDINDIISDYLHLLRCLWLRGIMPVICTVVPLGWHVVDPAIHQRLDKLNEFLRRDHYQVLDMYKLMVDNLGRPIYGFYQPRTRQVTGCEKIHLLWNNLGRQIALKALQKI